VEEVFVMRGGSRSGQACAFIRFTTAEGAIAAIQAVHGKYVMPGCSDPLVVRYADAPGSRVKKGPARGAAGAPPGGAAGGIGVGYPAVGYACGFPGGAGGAFAAGGAAAGGCYGGPSAYGQMGGAPPGYGPMGPVGAYGGAGMGGAGMGGVGGVLPGCCGGGHLGAGARHGCCQGMGPGMGQSGMGGGQLPGCCAGQCGLGGGCCLPGQCGMGAGGSMAGGAGLGGGLGGGYGGGTSAQAQALLALQQSGQLEQQGWGGAQPWFQMGMPGGGSPLGSPHGSSLQLNLLAQQQAAVQQQMAAQAQVRYASEGTSTRTSPQLQSQGGLQPPPQMMQGAQGQGAQGASMMSLLHDPSGGGGALSMYGMAQSLPLLKGQQAPQRQGLQQPGLQQQGAGLQQQGAQQGGQGGAASLVLGGTPVEGLTHWAAYLAPDGRTYYYNSETAISTWDKPTRDDWGPSLLPGAGRGEGSMLRTDSTSSFHQF